MIVIAKRFITYVFQGSLGHSLGKINCSLEEVFFFVKNLGSSPRKIHCSLGKLYFSSRNFFLFHEELAWD
jgi:hypothetical protein